jgi:hypothetical protein
LIKDSSKDGWKTHWHGTNSLSSYIITPCGNRIIAHAFGALNGNYSKLIDAKCGGSKIKVHTIPVFGGLHHPVSVSYTAGTTYKDITVAGHVGGKGGAGGNGTYWNHSAVAGHDGYGGGVNKSGGYTGYRGGTGGKGGFGGGWGAKGRTGSKGGTGGGQKSANGHNGIGGGPAGNSIKGGKYLVSGTYRGHMNGIVV